MISAVFENQQTARQAETIKQSQIDALFQEIDAIALERNRLLSENALSLDETQAMEQGNRPFSFGTDSVTTETMQALHVYDGRQDTVETALLQLGVRKIDPSDQTQISELSEFWAETMTAGGMPPPDFAAFANAYSLYIYDGTYTYNQVTYSYRYIRVVDDKGYSNNYDRGMYRQLRAVPLGGEVYSQSAFQRILQYNCGFTMSQLLGRISGSAFVEWTIGNLCTMFTQPGVTYTPGIVTYDIDIDHNTALTYYYVRDPQNQEWKLTGCKGVTSVSEIHKLHLNDNGIPAIDTYKRNFQITSGWSWSNYVKYFADNRPNTAYPFIAHEIGSLTYEGPDYSFTLTPEFYSNPSGLI